MADGQGDSEVATLTRTPAQLGGPDEPVPVDPRAQPFLDLVGWHRSQIELLCAQVTDRRDDAKEAIQRSLIAVWHRLDEGLAAPLPSMWLYREVRNAAVQVARERAAPLAEPQAAAGAIAAGHGDGATVRAVMLRLRPEFRSAFVLSDAIGFDEVQVADVEGVSPATAAAMIASARKSVAWGFGGGSAEEALGADGMLDLAWLTAPADPNLATPPFDRVRAALIALSTPGLWDRTWEFYLSQAMSSSGESATAAALNSYPPPVHAVPVGAVSAERDRRRAFVLVAAIVAALIGLSALVVSARRSDDGPAASLTSADGDGLAAGSDDGSAGARPAITRKKSTKASTTTVEDGSEGTDEGDDSGDVALDDTTDGDLVDESGDTVVDDGSDGSFDESGLDDGSFDDGSFDGSGFDEGTDFSDGSFDDSTDFFNDPDSVVVEGEDPEPTPTSPSSSATTAPSTSTASPAASAAVPLKVLAAADASSIKLKWSGAAMGATGVRLLWTCCNPSLGGAAGPVATAATYTITGLKPSTEYRVTLEVDGVDPGHNAVTVVIRTTAAGSSTTAKPPTTTTAPPTTTTTAPPTTSTPPVVTATSAPEEFNVPGGIPAPNGPSTGGD